MGSFTVSEYNNKTIFIEREATSNLQYAEGSTYNDVNSGSYPVIISMIVIVDNQILEIQQSFLIGLND